MITGDGSNRRKSMKRRILIDSMTIAVREEERSIDNWSRSKMTDSGTQGRSSAPSLFLVDLVRLSHIVRMPIHSRRISFLSTFFFHFIVTNTFFRFRIANICWHNETFPLCLEYSQRTYVLRGMKKVRLT